MNYRQFEDKIRQNYLNRILKGKVFEDACRTYVLKTRSPQYLSIQPVERDEYIDERHVHYFQKAMKHFSSEDPAEKHCYSQEELISAASRVTGLPEQDAASLLYQLFAFQVELTYSERGALCKKTSVFTFDPVDICEIAIPYDALQKYLPDEWYISLQIPEEIIDKMIWGCRKTGAPRPHPGSSHFAEQLLRLYKRRRGEFIQKYSFEMLKFFWLEYGSMAFPRKDVESTVRNFLALNATASDSHTV